MGMFRKIVSTLVCATPLLASPVKAVTVIDFDDIPVATFQFIDDGYSGLNWSNWGVSIGQRPDRDITTGYGVAAQGSPNVGFNWNASPASFSRPGGFFLNSMDMAAAWHDNVSVTVTGMLGGMLVDTMSFTLSTTSLTKVAFDWSLVDEVTVSSFGGQPVFSFGRGSHVAVDNLTISGPVPEPETYLLMVAGLLGVAYAVRQKRATT